MVRVPVIVRVPFIVAASSLAFTAGVAFAQAPKPAAAPAAAPTASTPAPAASSPAPATSRPPPPVPVTESQPTTQTGKIAYYGRKFAGRKTASGQRFDPEAMTMAHPTLPFGTRVRVTNLANDKSVIVRVNDRGPSTPGRIADLSQGAARQIGMTKAGVVEAKLEVLSVMTSR